MKLFARENVVGIFRGFKQGGLEFHAEIVLPYNNRLQTAPMHGQFVLIQLETEDEGVLGRITSISSEGKLTSSSGEDYGIRAVSDDRQIPEDLREQYLKYCVEIRVLGVIRDTEDGIVFVASHRRLPHVGSKVAFLCDDLLKEIAGHNIDGAELGFFALGEFVYCGTDKRCSENDWIKAKNPAIIPRFPIDNLVSRRSFIFARAGFGKSNLNKLLFSNLYREPPMVIKRKGRKVPVGTVIFDPDGEYYWPDDKGRPGLCDVPWLQDQLVVFTKKKGPSGYYQSFVASDIKLDIRRLKPSDVISIALAPEKQDQQNVRKLKALRSDGWTQVVDEIYKNGNLADKGVLMELLGMESNQEGEVYAARANMTTIVRMLHDPGSQMLEMLISSLKDGKLCVVDVSQLRGEPSRILSGIILQRIFDYNQEQFTEANPETIPTIAVIEEAQSVLNDYEATTPYITWVKEGRKYDLGAVLITQQPGSIDSKLLSQGDNWFVFHLLSAGDLQALRKANAHFSDDILSSLLNEPLVGHGVFWSSVAGKSYPVSVRVLSFNDQFTVHDPDYGLPSVDTYAKKLRKKFEKVVLDASRASKGAPMKEHKEDIPINEEEGGEITIDLLEEIIASAIRQLENDEMFMARLRSSPQPWMAVQQKLHSALPDAYDDSTKKKMAFEMVPKAMTKIFGADKEGWHTERQPSKSDASKMTTYIHVDG